MARCNCTSGGDASASTNSGHWYLDHHQDFHLTEWVLNATVDDQPDDAPIAGPLQESVGVWLHPREEDRLESLHSYGVLDAPIEPGLEDVARLAAAVCGASAAVVSLVDRDYQRFVATHGLVQKVIETPRIDSICSDAVATESKLILEDAAGHPRYARTALVAGDPHVRAYAGVPLIGRDGLPLGTLCVLDWHPRTFSDIQIEHLEILAEQVVIRLELQRVDRASGRSDGLQLSDALDARRLRRAIEDGEFTVLFQPIVDMRTDAVAAIEALVRWNHPELGLVPPALFLPAMEQTGLMIPLGRYVLRTALSVAAELRHLMGNAHVPTFNVNISSSELRSPGLAAAIGIALADHDLAAETLCIEVTETAPLPGASAIQELEMIRTMGVGIAIDDFGSGTATLGQVEALPATAIKIDRELVLGAERSERGMQILHAACCLARDLHLQYCVEGIETMAQRDLLLAEGVEYGQGWLFSTPLDVQQLFTYVTLRGTAAPAPLF